MRASDRHADPDPVTVSVVIAARDAAATLPDQLRALAAQRAERSWEVIVADNGSTDGTRDVVEDARSWLPQARLVDASGTPGAGAARNAAAEVARGGTLLFCDADDVVAPGWIDALGAAVDRTGVVAGRLEWHRLNDRSARRSRALPQVEGLQYTEPLPWLPCAAASNLGIGRELFHRIGRFDPRARWLQDTDLCWRAQLAGSRLEFEPAAVVHMRLRHGLRDTWDQGRHSGMGQRWLAARYGDVREALAVHHEPAPPADVTAPVVPAPRRQLLRSRPVRVARRAGTVAGELARVRSRGDVARLSWSTGFGLGYALGGLPDPEPFPPAEVAGLAADGRGGPDGLAGTDGPGGPDAPGGTGGPGAAAAPEPSGTRERHPDE
ncbi:glycosyltransferase family A protein [Cellulomonas sp. ES6]|uniref:glycosyltransferase n=1 Tax=Cellulomonas sp. ES6 TaxID=3039384 RepID=UPI0024B778E7|nr:glycosyltransferase family A protein [Cellulomonas sp. ES6]WHP18720.1 glycosyltransferase family A protein [Cellulomonas sp. ES6]